MSTHPGPALVVAIDGPSGSGKSSVSRAVARELGVGFVDTGATYRAVTWWCLEQGVDLSDQRAVAGVALSLPLELSTDPEGVTVVVGGADVSAAIRTSRVSEAVSAVATNLDVREILVRRQRELIDRTVAVTGGCVAEGRDVTSVVAPTADVRILLTASVEARLARRATELHGAADAVALAATHDQVVRRDRDDSTVSQFLTAGEGVVTVDTSELDFEGSVRAVLEVVHEVAGARR